MIQESSPAPLWLTKNLTRVDIALPEDSTFKMRCEALLNTTRRHVNKTNIPGLAMTMATGRFN